MQAIPIALAVGAKVVGGIAALKAGNANKKALYGQAHEEESAGAEQELRVRAAARQAIGAQVAAQAGNGFVAGTGSALDALADSQTNMAIDVLQVRRDAALKAKSLRTEGKMASTRGKFALAEGLIGAASAGVQMGTDWAQAKGPG